MKFRNRWAVCFIVLFIKYKVENRMRASRAERVSASIFLQISTSNTMATTDDNGRIFSVYWILDKEKARAVVECQGKLLMICSTRWSVVVWFVFY